jgi:hypothetical protein
MDLSNHLLICATTGTILDAGDCYLVPSNALDSGEAYSDSEVCIIAKERGAALSDCVNLDDSIASADDALAGEGEFKDFSSSWLGQ